MLPNFAVNLQVGAVLQNSWFERYTQIRASNGLEGSRRGISTYRVKRTSEASTIWSLNRVKSLSRFAWLHSKASLRFPVSRRRDNYRLHFQMEQIAPDAQDEIRAPPLQSLTSDKLAVHVNSIQSASTPEPLNRSPNARVKISSRCLLPTLPDSGEGKPQHSIELSHRTQPIQPGTSDEHDLGQDCSFALSCTSTYEVSNRRRPIYSCLASQLSKVGRSTVTLAATTVSCKDEQNGSGLEAVIETHIAGAPASHHARQRVTTRC